MKKIYIINDTSSCHAGSIKVMDNIHQYVLAGGHQIIGSAQVSTTIDSQAINNCDIVVVNGEGTLHHNAPWAIKILEAMEYAQNKGKPVYLLNTLYQSMNPKYNNIIKKCDVVIARELYSYNNLSAINPDTVLCLDFCGLNNTKVESPIPNTSGIYKTQTHPASIYKNCLSNLNYPVCSIGHKMTFDQYVATYRKMDLLVTGQHHAVYASIIADTPFVPTFGNSFKIESFLDWMNFGVMVCADDKQINEEIKKTQQGVYHLEWNVLRSKFFAECKMLKEELEQIFNV